MKKFAIGLCLMFIAVIVACPLTACTKSKGKVRLSEVTHSVFYAPLYVAINNGYFEDEGIEIELSNGGGANNVMTALITDAVDIGLMGPEATVYVAASNETNHPLIFGQLTNCDGSFLIGRTAQPDFKWSDLKGKHVIAGRKAGMPAMTLQYVINQAGVSLEELDFDTSVDFNLMAAAFEGNTKYDYVTAFEPTASAMIAAGKGHIVASVGKDSGAVPYTTFSATKKYMEKNPETIKGFLRAIVKGYEFMQVNTPEVVAAALAPSFEGTELDMLVATVKSYIAISAWKSTPVMFKEDFDLLQTIMENAGELSGKVTFESIVNNSFAEEVLKETKK